MWKRKLIGAFVLAITPAVNAANNDLLDDSPLVSQQARIAQQEASNNLLLEQWQVAPPVRQQTAQPEAPPLIAPTESSPAGVYYYNGQRFAYPEYANPREAAFAVAMRGPGRVVYSGAGNSCTIGGGCSQQATACNSGGNYSGGNYSGGRFAGIGSGNGLPAKAWRVVTWPVRRGAQARQSSGRRFAILPRNRGA